MFDFLKKITSDNSKKEQPPSNPPKSQIVERKSEEPRQTMSNGLSKQLFSDIKINRPTSSITNKSEIQNPIPSDKKFRIFDENKGKEEEKSDTFANYMNASMNFGRLKPGDPDIKEDNLKEFHTRENNSKDARFQQINKNIAPNTKATIDEKNIRKKIFDEKPPKKMGDDIKIYGEDLRKNSDDLMAEKSLHILQCNQNVIMKSEDNLRIEEAIKEIDAHYFNENTEDNLIHKELLRLPRHTKIDDVAARVEVLDKYSTIIASKLSKNALKHYEKFGWILNKIRFQLFY